MTLPRVTVVIPCFNHGRFVADAVRSCLVQEQADVRIVVVDDGSDDGTTPEACDACVQMSADRVTVVHQTNKGLAAARNAGAAKARQLGGEWAGEYLTFLDADDWIEPTFVTKLHSAIVSREHPVRVTVTANEPHAQAWGGSTAGTNGRSDAANQSGVLDSSPDADISHAYCQERLVELHEMVWAVPEWNALLMMVTNLHPVTTLIRRECFEAIGGFDESMREGYEDWDLWLRFIERGWSGARVREPLFIWRRHSQNTMIVEAGKRHERLFARLVSNHAELYQRHAEELLVLSNRLLRQSDANWLDETGEAIVVRDTRKHVQSLIAERDAARNEIAVQRAALHGGDCDALDAIARERELHAEESRTLNAQVAAFAREQVSVLGRIGELTRERNEARDEHKRVASLLESAAREAERTRAELETMRSERDATLAKLEAERVENQTAQAHAAMTMETLNQARVHHTAELASTRAAYEAKPAIRFSRAVHRVLDQLPAPLSRLVKGMARQAIRLVGGGRRSE